MSSLKDVGLKDDGLKDDGLKDDGLKDVSLKDVVVPLSLWLLYKSTEHYLSWE